VPVDRRAEKEDSEATAVRVSAIGEDEFVAGPSLTERRGSVLAGVPDAGKSQDRGRPEDAEQGGCHDGTALAAKEKLRVDRGETGCDKGEGEQDHEPCAGADDALPGPEALSAGSIEVPVRIVVTLGDGRARHGTVLRECDLGATPIVLARARVRQSPDPPRDPPPTAPERTAIAGNLTLAGLGGGVVSRILVARSGAVRRESRFSRPLPE
jgi:hypothetical protein